MKVLAIRGATTVNSNNKEEILKETSKLIEAIILKNNLNTDDIVSMCFTMTKDLDAVYPAVAVREILDIHDIPMLNYEEKYIQGSLNKCIRVMMHINTEKTKSDINHIYLNNAKNLRKDLIINRRYKMKNLVIAVDGPAGAGKSTIAKLIAEKLNINYIDTGAMYRAITYKCLQNNIDINNEKEVINIAKDCEIDFKDNNIYLNGEILTDEIRTMEVSNNVSNVAKIKEVRYLMVDVQRNIGKVSSVILDGRDIGSYVFPNADYKFFLIATPEERGNRRYKELVNKGYNVNLEEIIKDIIKRDEIDSNREFAPLVKAEDAIEIDTTGKSINEVVQSVLSKINI